MGVTAGLGTAWMMVLNGLLIGVVGTACFRAGLSLSLWSFVAPHGSLELPAIFIAGGAGLILGRGLLDPGMLPRREALAESGGLAIRLLLGVIPLLIVAGAIEGFVSPVPLPPATEVRHRRARMFVLLGALPDAAPDADRDTSSPRSLTSR